MVSPRVLRLLGLRVSKTLQYPSSQNYQADFENKQSPRKAWQLQPKNQKKDGITIEIFVAIATVLWPNTKGKCTPLLLLDCLVPSRVSGAVIPCAGKAELKAELLFSSK